MRTSTTAILLLILVLQHGHADAQTSSQPVTYHIDAVTAVRRGDAFTAAIHFRIAAPWYLYAPTGINAEQGVFESQVTWLPPPGIARHGKVQLPQTQFKNGFEVISGNDVVMEQEFRALPSAKVGTYEIKGRVVWQSCSDQVCLPPVTEVVVLKVMLN